MITSITGKGNIMQAVEGLSRGYERTVDVVERQTKEYWQLSLRVLGRCTPKITVMNAIDGVNALEYKLGPHRPLLRSVQGLSAVVVEGRRIKKPESATVTFLRRIAASAIGV